MKESILAVKSFDFAIRVVNFYKYLFETNKERKSLFYPNSFCGVELQ
jgi:hypothetical protein